MNTNYVYIYLDPRKRGHFSYRHLGMSFLFEPFYVGRGKGNRISHHLHPSTLNNTKSYKNNKIKAIIADGYNPKEYRLKIDVDISLNESKQLEQAYVFLIGRIDLYNGPLTNKTNGGDTVSENTKIYGSPKEKHPLWGVGHSDESRKRISTNHADVSGGKNGRAKAYIFIDPLGTEHHIHGSFVDFITSNLLPLWHLITRHSRYLNQGKITLEMLEEGTNGKARNKTKKLLGWEIKSNQ